MLSKPELHRKRLILVLLIVIGCWSLYNRVGQVQLGPGVMAPAVPQQKNIDSPERHRLNQYAITKRATFAIKAKVLSKKHYQFDRGADLAPTDLALGWGKMSDERILEKSKYRNPIKRVEGQSFVLDLASYLPANIR